MSPSTHALEDIQLVSPTGRTWNLRGTLSMRRGDYPLGWWPVIRLAGGQLFTIPAGWRVIAKGAQANEQKA